LSLVLVVAGPAIIHAMTDLTLVQLRAREFLGFAATYVALSVFAFQLDGIFIGTTHTREMRDTSLLSAGVFLVSSALLVPQHGPNALWLTFIGYIVVRGITLAVYYPRLRRSIGR
jgi:MATE family multidrug resistance protein